eukprot:TRINITY_DN4013_c0_g4_i1.p1 TRINITY_DN4013_c0_g4~~TRINITY_DN4013_c0_g4_i1.p1  ORF type:complete len:438 (-),score=63.97 TRINITY_DN4013_c0_g4_i1:47-1360(-)
MGHSSEITCLHKGAGFLFSGSLDCTAIQWHVHSGNRARTFQGHTERVNDICLDDAGDHLFTASNDHTVRQYGLALGQLARVLAGHSRPVCAIGSVGGRLLSAGSTALRVWDLASGECVGKHKHQAGSVSAMVLCKVQDGHGFMALDRLFTASSRGFLTELRLDTQTLAFSTVRVVDIVSDTSLGVSFVSAQKKHKSKGVKPVGAICVMLPGDQLPGAVFAGCHDGQVRQLDEMATAVGPQQDSQEEDTQETGPRAFVVSEAARTQVTTLCDGAKKKKKKKKQQNRHEQQLVPQSVDAPLTGSKYNRGGSAGEDIFGKPSVEGLHPNDECAPAPAEYTAAHEQLYHPELHKQTQEQEDRIFGKMPLPKPPARQGIAHLLQESGDEQPTQPSAQRGDSGDESSGWESEEADWPARPIVSPDQPVFSREDLANSFWVAKQ